MKEKKLDKGILKIWLLIGTLIFLGLAILAVVAYILMNENLKLPMLLSDIIVLLIGAVFCFLYPILRHKYYTYSYDEKHIFIRRGIIFRNQIFIPVCQIQDMHIHQGPFQMLFKVAEIEISTAGSNYYIVGLKQDVANKMVNEFENNLLKRLEELDHEKTVQ